jgi:hypothetical protein
MWQQTEHQAKCPRVSGMANSQKFGCFRPGATSSHALLVPDPALLVLFWPAAPTGYL